MKKIQIEFLKKMRGLITTGKEKSVELVRKIAVWPVKKKVVVSSIGVLMSATIILGVVYINNQMNKKDEEDAAVIEEVEEPVMVGSEVSIPAYTSVAVSSESMEKDLTLYFTQSQESDDRIEGVNFSVKLVSKDNEEPVNACNDVINNDNHIIELLNSSTLANVEYNSDLDSQLKEIVEKHSGDADESSLVEELSKLAEEQATQDDDAVEESDESSSEDTGEDKDVAEALEQGDTILNAETGAPVTMGEHYTLQKQVDIASYVESLNTVEGNIYTDDDNDGMIHVDEIDAGDYKACFIPTDTYDASSYATDVNVKDQVEYTPVENIKKKTVSASAAGDTQPAEAAPQEAVAADTVEYVQSSTKTYYEYEATSAKSINVSLGSSYNVNYPDGTGTVSVSSNAITIYSVSGKNSANITFTDNNGCISGYTVSSIPSGISASLNGNVLSITGDSASDVSGDIVVTATYTANANAGTTQVTESTSTITFTIPVTLVGSTTTLTADDGSLLYVSNNDSAAIATIANYTDGGTYYKKIEKIAYYGWQTLNGNRYFYDQNGNYVTGTQVIQGTTYNFGSDGVLLTSGMGIDVSKWQGNIDWNQAKSSISFAIIRCGFRGTSGGLAVDPKYSQNMKGAKAAGVKVGVYFYSRATTEAEAVEEASLAIQLVREQGGVSLPIYIDMEADNQASLSNAERNAIINAFCNTVSVAGYKAGLYASYNWLTKKIDTGSLSGISIWCARYNTYCGLPYAYDIWQYSSKGSIPGISGNVDLNISYF